MSVSAPELSYVLWVNTHGMMEPVGGDLCKGEYGTLEEAMGAGHALPAGKEFYITVVIVLGIWEGEGQDWENGHV
jgi:hypothetical protein